MFFVGSYEDWRGRGSQQKHVQYFFKAPLTETIVTIVSVLLSCEAMQTTCGFFAVFP